MLQEIKHTLVHGIDPPGKKRKESSSDKDISLESSTQDTADTDDFRTATSSNSDHTVTPPSPILSRTPADMELKRHDGVSTKDNKVKSKNRESEEKLVTEVPEEEDAKDDKKKLIKEAVTDSSQMKATDKKFTDEESVIDKKAKTPTGKKTTASNDQKPATQDTSIEQEATTSETSTGQETADKDTTVDQESTSQDTLTDQETTGKDTTVDQELTTQDTPTHQKTTKKDPTSNHERTTQDTTLTDQETTENDSTVEQKPTAPETSFGQETTDKDSNNNQGPTTQDTPIDQETTDKDTNTDQEPTISETSAGQKSSGDITPIHQKPTSQDIPTGHESTDKDASVEKKAAGEDSPADQELSTHSKMEETHDNASQEITDDQERTSSDTKEDHESIGGETSVDQEHTLLDIKNKHDRMTKEGSQNRVFAFKKDIRSVDGGIIVEESTVDGASATNNTKLTFYEKLMNTNLTSSRVPTMEQDYFKKQLYHTAESWKAMWEYRKNKYYPDYLSFWKRIYEGVNLITPLPHIQDVGLLMSDAEEPLGWKFAKAFTEYPKLAEDIVIMVQILDEFDESNTVKMDDIKSIIQTNIRHIFLKPVYVEAVENLICCTDCIVRDLQDLKYQKLQSLEKTETRDIFHILKQFFHISTETFVNYNTIKEGGRTIECLDTIFSWITDVYFVDNQHELYASISDEWENLKERGSSEGIRHADVIHLADRVYQLIKRLQRYDTKKLHDAVTHIFEPYQGGFAPLQISLLHQALKSVFISQESKNPTLQMDYYTLLANIFPVICDEYGPMTIERIESDKVDGYQFILDDIKVDLSHVVPQMAHYTSGSFIQKVISMTMSDYFEYYFNTMSFTCDVYKYTYYKLKGFPLWSDTGSAKLLVNHMAITLRVKKTVLPNGEVVFSVMKCDCAIKDMDIQIANSHRHKFFNSMFNAPMKSSIEAALTHEISSFLHNSISTLFSIN